MKAQRDWVHVFYKDSASITRTLSVPLKDFNKGYYTQSEEFGECDMFNITTNDGKTHTINIENILTSEVGSNIPSIVIDIDDNKEVTDKETYLKAKIRVDGYEAYSDIPPTSVQIKGRGNSTWGYPKKPYRLKFDKKVSLLDKKKAKSYVLLANYIDNTLMRNALSLHLAELLGMPYTNSVIPVNLYINGTYRGSYMLTEKVGINSGSVNIDDEKGILFELDTNYDEDYQFVSEKYSIPVMINDPDLSEIYPDAKKREAAFEAWREDFNRMEQAVFDNDSIDKYIDLQSLANYMIVYAVSGNQEINHPKSCYLYKERMSAKYKFGPVWDFDWAYTYNGKEYTDNWNKTLIVGSKGAPMMFKRIMRTPEFQEIYARQWDLFYNQLREQLFEFFDTYREWVRVSAYQNGELWTQSKLKSNVSSSETFDENCEKLHTWLEKRIEYLNKHKNHGLY